MATPATTTDKLIAMPWRAESEKEFRDELIVRRGTNLLNNDVLLQTPGVIHTESDA